MAHLGVLNGAVRQRKWHSYFLQINGKGKSDFGTVFANSIKNAIYKHIILYMSNQFSPRVSEILSYSREEASRLASSSVGPEHLLLGMMRLKDSPALEIMVRLNIDYKTLRQSLKTG